MITCTTSVDRLCLQVIRVKCSFLLWFVALAGMTLFPNRARAEVAADFYLQNGGRVVFYGDSITDQRLYSTLVETYVVTRFPKLKIDFVHSGWGGDRVAGGAGGVIDVRLQRDVIAYRPNVVTVMLGMNDAGYRPFEQERFDTYRQGYRHIVQTLSGALPKLRLTLVKPSPFDDVTQPVTFEGGYNAVLKRYGEFVEELGREFKQTVADMNTPVVTALTKASQTNLPLAKRVISDRVHPGPAGHLVMALALLKDWNAPALVSSVEIDAAAARIVKAAGATVENLKFADALTWEQIDAALPMPVDLEDPATALMAESSDFMELLNRQIVRVNNLPARSYELKIDGRSVGVFAREQLADGINLASLATPMMEQAKRVHKLTVHHNFLHMTKWRRMEFELQHSQTEALKTAIPIMTEALILEERQAIEDQRAVAQPVRHKFELNPQG